ncbi:MAG: glutamate--tRNA ligase [Myxococcales bacterium]|nr:glutamate--tRNA ligase [Myxococcales bacterium]
MTDVRVRIAPSPTGDPHVGTAYIALFNIAFARKHGGRFILRIEDTDQVRSTRESEEAIFEALRWLGLTWDEGPDIGGPYGPYRQSERREIYAEHAKQLVASGEAYPCFCSSETLSAMREEQMRNKLPLGYDGRCRKLTAEEARNRIAAGESHVIRLRVPAEGETIVRDRLRGDVSFQNSQVDDQVLIKADGSPTYHLANVVDDHLMQISHVIRGEEWISSTPKHVQLYRAFGWQAPEFIHLPLLRNPDKSKLSKRKNPVSINYYRRLGVLPEALVNFLGMMGYSMPDEREKFSVDELIAEFEIDRVKLSGPVFGLDKLKWLTGLYLREMSEEALLDRILGELYTRESLARFVKLLQPRIEVLGDFHQQSGFFYGPDGLGYAPEELLPKKRSAAEMLPVFRKLSEQFDALRSFTVESVDEAIKVVMEETGYKARDVFLPLRIAVTGSKASPELHETIVAIGPELCRQRIRLALEKLSSLQS